MCNDIIKKTKNKNKITNNHLINNDGVSEGGFAESRDWDNNSVFFIYGEVLVEKFT